MEPSKAPMRATKAIETPTTSTMPPINKLETTLSFEHYVTVPATPTLSSTFPAPSRDPETLGTLIEIRESEEKGLGIFALCDIPPQTILLCEIPLLTLQDDGTRVDPLDTSVNALSPERKKVFFSLYSYSRNKHESLSRSILYSNGFSIMDDLATGLFETASRFNHSCVPNSHYTWKDDIGRIVFWNRFKLLAGEEVTVDYGHTKKYLKHIYGFDCACGGCTDSGSDARSDGVSSSGSDAGATEDIGKIDEVLHEGDVKGGKI